MIGYLKISFIRKNVVFFFICISICSGQATAADSSSIGGGNARVRFFANRLIKRKKNYSISMAT